MNYFIKILSFIVIANLSSALFALKVEVQNNSGIPVNVKLHWSEAPQAFVLLSQGNNFYTYNSWLHHLQYLQVIRNDDRSCSYIYNLDAYDLKGTGTLSIIIGNNGFNSALIQGSTDIVRKGATFVNFEVPKQIGSCNR